MYCACVGGIICKHIYLTSNIYISVAALTGYQDTILVYYVGTRKYIDSRFFQLHLTTLWYLTEVDIALLDLFSNNIFFVK